MKLTLAQQTTIRQLDEAIRAGLATARALGFTQDADITTAVRLAIADVGLRVVPAKGRQS